MTEAQIEEAKSIAADINSLLPGEMRQMTFWHNAALKMAAALALPHTGVVKGLEWTVRCGISYAETVVGVYKVAGNGAWWINHGPVQGDLGRDAAQSDYERRIRSALIGGDAL
jgi:hypothetical protein